MPTNSKGRPFNSITCERKWKAGDPTPICTQNQVRFLLESPAGVKLLVDLGKELL